MHGLLNLSQLWGSVPYITVPATSNNYDEILHSPVRSPQDLCWGLLNELQDITRLPGGCVKSKNQVFFDILYKRIYIFALLTIGLILWAIFNLLTVIN